VISQAIKVHLNGKRIQIKGFNQYVDMYLGKGEGDDAPKKVWDKSTNNERWEVIASVSEGQFQQVSFVNSICTIRGGTHVNMVTDQIIDKLSDALKKKHKNLNVKPFQIRSHLWIFVNSQIENPAFDSQTKETLTLKASQFGSKCEVSEKFVKELLKSGILDTIILQAKAKEDAKLAKTLTATKKSRLLGIPKLEDANMAGTKNADICTLILTEGDSAKSLAMAGLEVVGRDKYGVFPLKGKLLNVREANTKMLTENQEIQNIIKILGLNFGKKYDNTRNLRYGRLMIMADQDHDGSHIKGLIINFIHHFWPSLIKMNGFLKEFITPIIKATRGKEVLSFYTINDYKTWELRNLDIASQYRIKYYKGKK
jgi:DNA topoisomerase II